MSANAGQALMPSESTELRELLMRRIGQARRAERRLIPKVIPIGLRESPKVLRYFINGTVRVCPFQVLKESQVFLKSRSIPPSRQDQRESRFPSDPGKAAVWKHLP